MDRETLITNIFNRMSYNDCKTENTDDEKIMELYPNLKNLSRIQSLSIVEEMVQQDENRKWCETPCQKRASILLDIGRRLSEEAPRLSELQNFREKDYSLLIDSFYYYSNICYQFEKNWTDFGYDLVVLSSDVPFSALGSVISAVFGAGRGVVIFYSINNPWFLLFLKQVFSSTTLPKDLFILVPNYDVDEREIEDDWRNLFRKIVFFGNHLSAMDLYEKTSFASFSFVNINKTATIIFEFCDLNAAIDKIFYETWDEKTATIWGVSTVVVQESVYQNFLNGLELRIDQLTDEQKSALIKDCIISEEDRHRESETNGPVLKVFSCRTANEGVDFLNSYQYYLGTSIWSENSSQALEVASKLICNNVWINCHGIIEPSIPFQSSDNDGSVAFGGYEGILEYGNVGEATNEELIYFDLKEIQVSIEETVLSAQKAFKKWLLMKNKGIYLTKIAGSLMSHYDLFDLSDLVTKVLSTKNTNPVPRSCNRNFYIIQEKLPIGVIAIILKRCLTREYFVYLITIAIALGNAVVLVLGESSRTSFVESLVNVFNIHLPKGLLSVIAENEDRAAISLASNRVVRELWFGPRSAFSDVYIRRIRKITSKTLKRIWLLPNPIEFLSHARIYRKKCVSNKIIWLTKVDHFP